MPPLKKINIWSQTKNGRVFVGQLWRENGKYSFEYDRSYQRSKSAVPLGPEFKLLKRSFSSKELFPTFVDRIPSKENPSYRDYCAQWNISPDESDPFVLLTTIGRRGPSTFVFEPPLADVYGAKELKIFRERLQLNQREFSSLFGLTQATLARIETGKTDSPLILRYVELCDKVPAALKWVVDQRGQYIHDQKRALILDAVK